MIRIHQSAPRRRRALTLIEVLLILLALLIAAGLFITYLQQLREAANRAHCANNLRLLGEAIYYFEGTTEHLKEAKLPPLGRLAAQGTLPPARIAKLITPDGDAHPLGYATWAVLLAPYLRADDPLKDWDVRKPYVAQTD